MREVYIFAAVIIAGFLLGAWIGYTLNKVVA